MYFLYSLLFGCYALAASPFLLYKTWRRQKYFIPGLRERLGFLPGSLRFDGRPTIWFHACSVGETLSVQPLAHALHKRFPEVRFVFSAVTQTGLSIAEERFARYGEGNVFYFPFDLTTVARRVFDLIRPSMLVILETEIWPNVIHEARRRAIPVVLANGRISAQSFRFYRHAAPLLSLVFRNYEVLMMKSEEDAARIRRMGAPAEKVVVTGNIKYDRDSVETETARTQAALLSRVFSLNGTRDPLIVAGSTHADEEKTLLEVLRRLRGIAGLESTHLMLAPRHPSRFDEVAFIAGRCGFSLKRRSDPEVRPGTADVLLLDSLGELATAYAFATVVFVGGTLIPHGGQSILEPALHGKPIVIGPSMENFPQIIEDFLARGAVLQIHSPASQKDEQKRELTEAFADLLLAPRRRDEMGHAALSVLEGSRGASGLTVDRIASVLEKLKR